LGPGPVGEKKTRRIVKAVFFFFWVGTGPETGAGQKLGADKEVTSYFRTFDDISSRS